VLVKQQISALFRSFSWNEIFPDFIPGYLAEYKNC
jgi:hypothetical protein